MLHLDRVSFGYYQGLPLFEGLSFDVGAGELVHLAGQNGAGKTTLLKVISGLLEARSGEVRRASEAAFEYLASESNGHFLKLDARENLRFWLGLHGREIDDGVLSEAFHYWGMSPKLLQSGLSVEKYSTGMKRKLALARVQLVGAQVWLLDEPVLGLDEGSSTKFTEMLKGHLDGGGAAVVVSHDLNPLAGLISKTIQVGSV